MDNKQIKDLMAAMGRFNVRKIKFKTKEGDEIELECGQEQGVAPHHFPAPPPKHEPIHHPPAALSHPHHKVDPAKEASQKTPSGNYITSPMVGTFYSSPSPDEPPFVKVGDRVDADTVVCIIEAMKVMNEVKAGESGVIRETFLENSQPVEYGTKLFRIE